MSECIKGTVPVKLLFCLFNTEANVYEIRIFRFCNNCNEKLGEKEIKPLNGIPNVEEEGVITKVICNILSNGKQYEWFGHPEDRDNYLKNGDKWE